MRVMFGIRHLRWAFRRAACALLWRLDALNGVDALTTQHIRSSDLRMLDQVWKGDL